MTTPVREGTRAREGNTRWPLESEAAIRCRAMAPRRRRSARMAPVRRIAVALATSFVWTTAAAQVLVALPIGAVVDGDVAMSEITATSATLLVSTTIDVACVVVFGRSEEFGELALDADMGAGAHREHRVLLRGLDPDTEYVYRLQGSDANGRFYASDVLRFRTLAAEGTPPLGVNVATAEEGAVVVAVSSEFGGAYAAGNAIDGNPRSEWSSRGDGDGAYLTIRLAEPTEVVGFGFWTRTMVTSAEIRRFEVVNERGEVFGPFDVPDAGGRYDFVATGSGHEFTFRVVASTGGNTGAVEVAIYARPR